jgi:hypothetical protein
VSVHCKVSNQKFPYENIPTYNMGSNRKINPILENFMIGTNFNQLLFFPVKREVLYALIMFHTPYSLSTSARVIQACAFLFSSRQKRLECLIIKVATRNIQRNFRSAKVSTMPGVVLNNPITAGGQDLSLQHHDEFVNCYFKRFW